MKNDVQQFINWIHLRNPLAKTWRDYQCDLELFRVFTGGMKAENVSKKDVDEFIYQQIGRGFKPSSINRRLSSLSSFYAYMKSTGRKVICPVSPRRHYLPEPQRLPRPVHEDSLKVFFSQISNIMDRAMFTIMLRCGLRISEVAELRMGDLFLHEYPPRLIVRGKGGKERMAFLSSHALAALSEWLKERSEAKCDFVFLTYQKLGISSTSISIRMKHIRERCGVSFTAHQLRHTFADQLLSAGMPITSIQKLLGHRFLETTQNYAAANDKQVQEDFQLACNRLDGWSRLWDGEEVKSPIFEELKDGDNSLKTTVISETRFVIPDLALFLPKQLLRQLEAYRKLKSIRWRADRVIANSMHFYSRHVLMWRYFMEKWNVSRVSGLRYKHVLDFIHHRATSGSSASTINNDLSTLRTFLLFLKDDGLFVHASLDAISRLKQAERLPRHMSKDQVLTLGFEIVADSERARQREKRRDAFLLRAIFYLLWQGGMRVGEVEGLKFSDVFISNGHKSKRLFVRDGKWRKGRVVYLTDAVYDSLKRYLKFRKTENSDEGFVFTRNGSRLRKGYICKALKAVGKRLNIQVVPHQLRHTFATQLLNAGCKVTSIQKLLGHRNLNTTMIYARALDTTVMKDYLDAIQIIEAEGE